MGADRDEELDAVLPFFGPAPTIAFFTSLYLRSRWRRSGLDGDVACSGLSADSPSLLLSLSPLRTSPFAPRSPVSPSTVPVSYRDRLLAAVLH